MRGLIFLVVNLAVSTASIKQPKDQMIVEIGEDKDITEANKGLLHDDILKPRTQRSAIIYDDQLWESPVPYVLEKSLEMNAKGVILRALEQFRLKSCIDFKPRDSEMYYISVQKLGGCFSYIGRIFPNGQVLSIGRYCDEISTVEHEFLHALGFFHEQSRSDRDDYVEINFENIVEGFEGNFEKESNKTTTTNGVPYDYWSVMHYGPYAFSNGNGSTIQTKDPDFHDIIGQRLEVSPKDILELNLRYECDSTIAFKMFCGFSDENMCHMENCSDSALTWEMATHVDGGPSSDHTSLGNNGYYGEDEGYFMHVSTASGYEGDSARLDTPIMDVKRKCNVQCLQFYYYHSGSESDQLNIWIREFRNEWDDIGSVRLAGQITGPRTSHWRLHHVSLNATKYFQIEFEVRKGAGNSSGGFSIDDINLSEIECPHVTIQIDDFENTLNTSEIGTIIYSPLQYSRGGYAYTVAVELFETYVGLFVQLLSGKYDDELEWPLPQRQVTFQMLDQTPNIKLQMSKQRSITSDLALMAGTNDTYLWGNPREVGSPFEHNNETLYAGPRLGKNYFTDLDEMKRRQFLKGGTAIFAFSFEDLTPLINGSALPCPRMRPLRIRHPPKYIESGPCSPRVFPTFHPPDNTTDDSRFFTTFRPPRRTTDDKSIFGFCPGLVASPLLTLLAALMLLTR